MVACMRALTVCLNTSLGRQALGKSPVLVAIVTDAVPRLAKSLAAEQAAELHKLLSGCKVRCDGMHALCHALLLQNCSMCKHSALCNV